MSFKYEHKTGALRVVNGVGVADGTVRVDVDGAETAALLVNDEDAPAVALAILRAADTPDHHADVHCAISSLIEHEHTRTRQAEREAEDAKVREYTEAVLGHRLPETYRISDLDRRQYRAAREFFTGEIVAAEVVEPRTIPGAVYLHHGHQDATWRDKAGCLWDYNEDGWSWRARPDGERHISGPESFPWTEVLP